MDLSPHKRVILLKGDDLNILSEYIRSATVIRRFSRRLTACMRVPCIIGAVYVVKDSYFYLEGISSR